MHSERRIRRPAAALLPCLTALALGLATAPPARALESTGASVPGILDSRAPLVAVVAPAGGALFTGAAAETLRWTIDEQSWTGPAPVTATLLDGAVVLDQFTVAAQAGGVYAHAWTVSDVATADARLVVTAVDGFGWSGADTSGVFAIQLSTTDAPDALTADRLGPVHPNPFNPAPRSPSACGPPRTSR